MTTLDPNIPLAAGQIQLGPNPQQMISLMELGQKMRAQQSQQRNQNALRGLLSTPGSYGPNGQLTPDAQLGLAGLDPELAMKMRQNATTEELHQSNISLNQAHLKEAEIKRMEADQDWIQENVRLPSINAYDEAKRKGFSDQAAQELAQAAFTEGINLSKSSGRFSEDQQARLETAFDYRRVKQRLDAFKGYRDAQEKKRSDERAEKAEAEKERHDKEMERLAALREGRLGQFLAQRAGGSEEKLGADDVEFMAKQYLAGDKSVMQNLGRGVQGAKNIVALRREITRQAHDAGMSSKDVASTLAEFEGFKAGERTLGTRTANVEMAVTEATKFAELARKASDASGRTGFTPLNQALQAWQKGSGDPNISRFVAANNSFINAYARAVSPSGTPTVNDKEHAREMLNTAMTRQQYDAVIDQLQQEMTAARASPGQVKREMHGGGEAPGPAPKSAASAHPDDIEALLKKYGGK